MTRPVIKFDPPQVAERERPVIRFAPVSGAEPEESGERPVIKLDTSPDRSPQGRAALMASARERWHQMVSDRIQDEEG